MLKSRCFVARLHKSAIRRGNDHWLESIGPQSETFELPTESAKVLSQDEIEPAILKQEPEGFYVDEKNVFKYRDSGALNDEYGFSNLYVKLTDYFFGNNYHTINAIRGEKSVKKAQKVEQRTFQDLKILRVSSGKGGNGAVSFFRDANQPTGPPDGGDGGNGGDVYLKVVDTMNSLHRIRRSYVAKGGQPGKGSQLDGKKGQDVIIEVPKGTSIRWIPDPFVLKDAFNKIGRDNIWLDIVTNSFKDEIQFFRKSYSPGGGWLFSEHNEEYYRERDFFIELNKKVEDYDLDTIQEELHEDNFPILGMDLQKATEKPILLAKGGKGGMGNMNFLTKDVKNPRFAKQGRDGLTQFFLLELKLIADLGLVGLPNAGKSSLLRSISRARPRVGHWEFTTLQPTIGTIDTTIDKDPFTVADIPGIIKGASENKGMGLDFLRHIERCKGLVFVVSLENNPIEDLNVLIEELGKTNLLDKKKLVIATKADLTTDSDKYFQFKSYIDDKLNTEADEWNILPVCAIKNQNVEKCIALMSQIAGK